MWFRLFLLLLVGAVSAEHFQAWKTDTEYLYYVRGRTLTALHDFSDQYTGILIRALLTIRPKSEVTLEAKVTKAQYAQIHEKLPNGWKSDIEDSILDLKKLPISEKVFEIKMRHGVVRDLIVDKDVPTWEVNVLKSIVSLLQVDTQGENMMSSRYNQEPEKDRVNAMYKTMEDSVGGKCEVHYDINTLPDFLLRSRPELLPLRGKGGVIEIIKTKDYCNCEERVNYHFGTTESNNWKACTNENGKSLSQSSVSRIVATGNLKTFTIQYSVTTHEVILSPNLDENTKGMVSSRVTINLDNMGPVSSEPWLTPTNSESVGNLVYSYKNPISGAGENRHEDRPHSILKSLNSEEEWNIRNSDKGHDHDHDGFGTSRSSSNENFFENNEEQLHWQPTSNLDEAPFTPLLPFFVENRGKSMSKPHKFNPVVISQILGKQIGYELKHPNKITDAQSLEKFTILASLIRTMNTQQIAEALPEIYRSDNESNRLNEYHSVRRNSWAAFRDAVAQAGTGPALVTIKNWIKEKKINGIEAALVVAVLSKTARAPTPEYVDAFFKMATMPEVIDEEFLNSTAMITFAELVRFSQVNHHSAQTHRSVSSFGRARHNPAIFSDYIPYMAEQLKKSIENNELTKSHVFIRALGNIAHPKILTIFEPYLEGEIPASTFQRLLMVFSLNNLAALRPRLARGVLYRIYQNTAETSQLRSAAVAFLMTTNPSASMLQRMAEFTNYDHSRSVNAAVKSAIESASKLGTPESLDLATKARNVLSLLNKESYDNEYSDNYFSDYAASEWNLAYRTQAHIASDNFIALALYASLEAKYGDFEIPKSEIGALLSSFKDAELFKSIRAGSYISKNNNTIEFSPENIAKLLKIERKSKENLEGAFWTNSKYNNKFISFDHYSLDRLLYYLMDTAKSFMKGFEIDLVKMESYDLTLSFPMESGFPFLYTMKIPTMVKVSSSVKGKEVRDSIEGNIDLRLVYSMQIQGRLGFITPFEHQHYMTGVNRNLQFYVPFRAHVKLPRFEKSVTAKFQPIEQDERYRLMHYSFVPFTSRYNMLNMSPVMKDKETRKLINGELWYRATRARNLNYEMEADSSPPPGLYMDRSNWHPTARLIFALAKDDPEYSKVDIYLEPDESGEQSIILTGWMGSMVNISTTHVENRNKTSPKARAPTIKSKKNSDSERRSEFMKEVAEGISEPFPIAVDLGVEIRGKEPFQMLMTVAYANSLIDEKSQGLAYWSVVDPEWHVELESCIGFQSITPRMATIISQDRIFFQDANKFRSFDVDLCVGETCNNGYKIQIHGEQEQTEQYKKAVYELPVLSQCLKDVRTGAKSTPVCQDAGDKIYTMDKSRVTIKFDPKIRGFQEEVPKYFTVVDTIFPGVKWSIMERTSEDESIDDNVLEFSMDVDLSKTVANFSCESSKNRLIAEDLTIPFGPLVMNSHSDLSVVSERLLMNLTDVESLRQTCEFDYIKATTFDKATYPVDLGKCWHVAVTNYPKINIKTMKTWKHDMYLTVLVRDSADKKKDVQIVMGSNEVKFALIDSRIRVTVDGETVGLSKKDNNEEYLDFKLIQEPDGSVKFSSSRYEFDVIYDGKRVQIKASDEYRNDIRGLCGNYDGEPANDFMSPRDCAVWNSKEFVGSFALTSSDCEGPALENSKKANDTVCDHNNARSGNVVTDREAGRSKSGNKNWGFHNRMNDEKGQESGKSKRCITMRTKIIEEADQTCFSLRPIPTCSLGCKAIRTKPKVMPVYCIPEGKESQQMAEHIKQGANPDLSQKSPSKKSGFDIPVHCHAA